MGAGLGRAAASVSGRRGRKALAHHGAVPVGVKPRMDHLLHLERRGFVTLAGLHPWTSATPERSFLGGLDPVPWNRGPLLLAAGLLACVQTAP